MTTNGAGGPWHSETAWNQSGGGITPDGIPIPNWQAGVANTSNGGSTTLRNVPDVAAEADFDNYDCNMGTCKGRGRVPASRPALGGLYGAGQSAGRSPWRESYGIPQP